MAKESWYINESELDDYQVKIIRMSLHKSFIVKGCAGSGKTVLALWRVKELIDEGCDSYFVIVYTKALKQFIRDGINTIGVDANKVLYHNEWKKRDMPSADYIIVDEVQDFEKDEIQEFMLAAKKNLVLFGDSAQQIYSGLKDNLLTMEEIQVYTDIRMESLIYNHRLPKKIARVAERITKSDDLLEERCQKEGVNKPRLVACRSLHSQLDYIMAVVNAQHYTDVAILFHTNDDILTAKNYFIEKKWGVEAKVNFDIDLDFSTEYPKLMTLHSSKGLQFEAVFIPMCEVTKEKDRDSLYVGLTRSYRDLFILYSDSLSPLLDSVDKVYFDCISEAKSENKTNLAF